MSHRPADRVPAWPGLIPSQAKFVPADPDLTERVRFALKRRGTAERLVNAGSGRTFIRFICQDGTSYFLKAMPTELAAKIAAAERIARWLKDRGAPAIAAVAPEPLSFGDEQCIVVYPYQAGRAPDVTEADARSLGRALGCLHLALSEHPDCEAWRLATAQRIDRLSGIRARLAEGNLRAGPDPDRLAVIARDASIDFRPQAFQDLGIETALHGDLNVFNVIVTPEGPEFLDFEDVHHSFLPAVFDIATLYERVFLVRDQDDGRASRCAQALIRSYEDSRGLPMPVLRRLPDVLRGLALRALCTLCAIDPEIRDRDEWLKFFYLHDTVVHREAIFS